MISIISITTIIIINILFVKGQNDKCDEIFLNNHLIQCYKNHIDQTTTNENSFFLDGNILCQSYNKSSTYRQCLYSIFNKNETCSSDKYPFTYQYFKIYWKLILSSCLINKDDHCFPSPLTQYVIKKCQYSFDDYFPTKCKEFLDSLNCLEEYESALIPIKSQSSCSRRKAYYYYYGDVAARLLLSINICES